MRKLSVWYVTFRPRQRWARFPDRYFRFKATSKDQAMKYAIDIFGRDWEWLIPEKQWGKKSGNPFDEIDVSKLTEISYNEIQKEVERQSRIPYKTYREKEVRDGKSKRTKLDE